MTFSARRVVAALAAAMVLAGVFAAGSAPARTESPPKLVTASGGVDVGFAGYWSFDFTIRPWQLFGIPLGIASVSGPITSDDFHHTATTQQCLFGLGWNSRVTSTPRRSVTFTCVMFGVIDTLGTKTPFMRNQTVTVVDGPGGTIDDGAGPRPELGSNPIEVTFY